MANDDKNGVSASEKALPTARLVFERQMGVLRAYGKLERPAKNKELAEALGINQSTLSDANGFFLSTGFIRRGEGGYVASQELISYTHAYEWNPVTAGLKLTALVAGSWFHRALEVKTRVRAITEAEAVATLAEASKTATKDKARLAVLLDYLVLVGLVARAGDGRIEATSSITTAPADKEETKDVSKPQSDRLDVISVPPPAQKPDRARLATLLLDLAVDTDTPKEVLDSLWQVIKFLKGVAPEKREG